MKKILHLLTKIDFRPAAPLTHNADDIATDARLGELNMAKVSDNLWVMSRPYGLIGLHLRIRLKAAWKVFSGQADVLEWNDRND